MVWCETAVKPRPTVACRTAGHVSDNAPAQQLGIWVLAGGLRGAWLASRLVRGLCRHGESPLQHAAEALLGPCCSLTNCRKISKKSGSSAYCVSATSYIFDSDDRAGAKCSPTPQLVVGMDWSGQFEMREGQSMAWQTFPLTVEPVLPGAYPVLDWLEQEQLS